MLDIKWIRSNPEEVKAGLAKRNATYEIDAVLALDDKRKEIIAQVEEMKAQQNRESKLVPQYKREGKDCAPIFAEMKALGDKIKVLDEQQK